MRSRHTGRADGSTASASREMKRASWRSLACRRLSSPTTLRWSATRRMATPACGAGAENRGGVLRQCGSLEGIPAERLGQERDLVFLFRQLARLRCDLPLFESIDSLEWHGTRPEFAALVSRFDGATPARPHPPLVPTHHRDPRRRSLTVKTSCGRHCCTIDVPRRKQGAPSGCVSGRERCGAPGRLPILRGRRATRCDVSPNFDHLASHCRSRPRPE